MTEYADHSLFGKPEDVYGRFQKNRDAGQRSLLRPRGRTSQKSA